MTREYWPELVGVPGILYHSQYIVELLLISLLALVAEEVIRRSNPYITKIERIFPGQATTRDYRLDRVRVLLLIAIHLVYC